MMYLNTVFDLFGLKNQIKQREILLTIGKY